jgi:hypothetical protein
MFPMCRDLPAKPLNETHYLLHSFLLPMHLGSQTFTMKFSSSDIVDLSGSNCKIYQLSPLHSAPSYINAAEERQSFTMPQAFSDVVALLGRPAKLLKTPHTFLFYSTNASEEKQSFIIISCYLRCCRSVRVYMQTF